MNQPLITNNTVLYTLLHLLTGFSSVGGCKDVARQDGVTWEFRTIRLPPPSRMTDWQCWGRRFSHSTTIPQKDSCWRGLPYEFFIGFILTLSRVANLEQKRRRQGVVRMCVSVLCMMCIQTTLQIIQVNAKKIKNQGDNIHDEFGNT